MRIQVAGRCLTVRSCVQGCDGPLTHIGLADGQPSQTASPPPAVSAPDPCLARSAAPLDAGDGIPGAGFSIGALKRPRSSGMPIPTSRPQLAVVPYPSPLENTKRSRSSARTVVTHVPPLQSSPHFMRFGSMADAGCSQSALSNGLGSGLASAPATLSRGLLHAGALDVPLSSMEYEVMDSMAGSGGGSGSSGTALGGSLNSAADAHECADSKVRDSVTATGLLTRRYPRGAVCSHPEFDIDAARFAAEKH